VTAERLRQIERLFHEARERTPAERDAFLARACADDPPLRREVESLLVQPPAGVIDAPVGALVGELMTPPAPRLAPGSSVGPYHIEGLLDAGGMGEVYRARDTTLGRDVAIKILPRHFTSDAGRLTRFEREARLLATLNHPHIGAIYGIVDAEGVRGLVLELVEGPTLAKRLARGRLPIEEALVVARQIASALEAAHEQGIVHRDLKPANIKMTPAGQVKVLDFGIAKIADTGQADVTAPRTGTGLILGTPAYMSPEQARGVTVDKRADIWAFGCVLYEMLTGRGAFAAETASDSLAKVIEREPDWMALPGQVPESIRRLVTRCLQKDPANRLHDIADARIEITDALSTAVGGREAEADVPPRARVIRATLAVSALALLAAAVWWRPFLPSASRVTPAEAMEFGVTFPNNFMPADGVAISPDGRQIAANVWSNWGDIWVYSLDGSQPRPLPGGEQGSHPFWSPDSSRIGFFKGSQLVAMKATGGQLTSIASMAPAPRNTIRGRAGGSWNRDGVILFTAEGKLYQVSASGGSAPAEVPLASVTGEISGPTFLPDGRHFVVCVERQERGSVDLASLDGGPVTILGDTECPGGFAPPDRVLFVRGASVLAQKLDLRRLTLQGDAEVVASGVTRGAVGPWPYLNLSASDTGVLAFAAPRGGGSMGQLTWFNRDGKVMGAIDQPAGGVEYLNPAISPDGTIVAANRADPQTGSWHVWLIDIARGNAASRLTTASASDFDPVWSFDGKEIVYASDRGERLAFYRQSIVGGSATLVKDVSQVRFPIPSDWSQDGHILYQQLQRSVWAFLLSDAHAEVPLANRQSPSYDARLSPDGKWLAYASYESDRFDVFVERFPGGSPRKQVSNGGGTHPRWTNATELVYWVPPDGIKSTELSLFDQGIRVGTTRTLVAQPVAGLIDARTHYDITRDGQHILVRQPAGPPSPGIRVIVNWMAKLK
jgi:Tol biopolymer transport system component